MLLDTLYRQINSELDNNEKLLFRDVANLINEKISQLRLEYVQNGLGQQFLETDTVYSLVQDIEYPYLYSADLTKNIYRSAKTYNSVYQAVLSLSDNELLDETQTFSLGDFAIKDGKLYEAIKASSSVNTYDLTFEADEVKNYYVDNGLKYLVGDIVFNQSDSTWWKATTEYTNDQGETISASGAFEELYWRKVEEDAYIYPLFVEFYRLDQLKIMDYGFSISEDKLYTSFNDTPFTVTYLPEWEFLYDRDDELNIPDTMITAVKQAAVTELRNKLIGGNEQQNT